MACSKESIPVPPWVRKLEERLQINILKKRLAHEIGAGAPCLVCKDSCPGLDLHYWRNSCKNCKCLKGHHDFEEDEGLRFHILFENENDIRKLSKPLAADPLVLDMKVEDLSSSVPALAMKRLKFDWVPPEVSPALAADYMSQIPAREMPVSGSIGAERRKLKLKKQIPMHDIMPNSDLFVKERNHSYYNYLEKIRQNSGVGLVLRVKKWEKAENQAEDKLPSMQGKVDQLNNQLVSTFRNINLQPYHQDHQQSARPPPPVLPAGHYLQTSPSSALENLPAKIPSSTLRLPSAFLKDVNISSMSYFPRPNLDQTGYDSDLSGNMDETGYNPNMSGIFPLSPRSDCEESGVERDLKSNEKLGRASSLPIKREGVPESIVTPSGKTDPQDGATNLVNLNKNDSFASDKANANSEAGVPLAPAESSEVFLTAEDIRCAGCKEVIEDQAVAVFINKAQTSVLSWHPQCFVCKECRNLLVDLVYVYHSKDKSVYCGRHYPKALKIHRCNACDELIMASKFTLADDNYYHLNHFCCVECDMELGGKEYLLDEENSNQPICLPCFEHKYSKRCNTCGQNIGVRETGVYWCDLQWHSGPECFKCYATDCQKPLEGQMFLVVHSQPYCSKECRDKPQFKATSF